MSIPVSGEQHERAVEAAAQDAFWQDDKGGHIKGRWTWGTIPEAGRENYRQTITAAIDSYLASLREQGVHLVDLREVCAWLRSQPGAIDAVVAGTLERDFPIERRFGGNERSES